MPLTLPAVGPSDSWGGPINTALTQLDAATTSLATRVTTLESAPAAVTTVAGRSGTVTLAKTDVGLANVDNTADVSKPVSTAQAAAIATKQNVIRHYADLTAAAAGLAANEFGDGDLITVG